MQGTFGDVDVINTPSGGLCVKSRQELGFVRAQGLYSGCVVVGIERAC